jgi:hypothetical protein
MEAEATVPKTTENENGTESDTIKEVNRKVKLDTYLTSRCGYGRKKQKLLDQFWTIVWSGLEKASWRKVGRNFTFLPSD